MLGHRGAPIKYLNVLRPAGWVGKALRCNKYAIDVSKFGNRERKT